MTKLILILALSATTFPLSAQPNNPEKINWPSRYDPSRSSFYVHNEIEINASPEKVWEILIDALKWQSWYAGARNVIFTNVVDSVLTVSTVFKWETMGLKFESTIMQFEPYSVLAWESKKKSIQGFHVWLIIPNGKSCKVITDESQNGWLTYFEKIFQPKKLKRLHDEWLLALKKRSEATN